MEHFWTPKYCQGDGLVSQCSCTELVHLPFLVLHSTELPHFKTQARASFKKHFHPLLPVSEQVNQESNPGLFLPLKMEEGRKKKKQHLDIKKIHTHVKWPSKLMTMRRGYLVGIFFCLLM